MFTFNAITVGFLVMMGTLLLTQQLTEKKLLWLSPSLKGSLEKFFYGILFTSAIYCFLAGISLLTDWEPFFGKPAGEVVEAALESNALNRPNRILAFIVVLIWPYFLIFISGCNIFISTAKLFLKSREK
jgi:hypothetical protein